LGTYLPNRAKNIARTLKMAGATLPRVVPNPSPMPRQPRLFIPGGFYHVTARGNHQQPLFRDVVDYRALDQIVAAALDPAHARLHAYCWMTNHIHLLVEIAELPLGVLMQRIGTRFARAMQKRVPTTGHLFENRYHARLVNVDEYFLVLLRYIHLNPVRAGMVAGPDQYPWSSHDIYCGRRQAVWVTTDFGLAFFASRTPEARRRYRRYLDETTPTDDLPTNPKEPRVLGSRTATAAGPRSAPPPPRKSLAALASDVCAECGTTLADLASTRRCSKLNHAREMFAARAVCERVATQREVAVFLHRSVAAISRAATRGQSARRSAILREPDNGNSVQLRKT
jgi:REP element-mobilizing transposase RayT